MIAAVIVTIMLIPQSLAYAMLAASRPRPGLYASILPIILYAIFGTSRAAGRWAGGRGVADDRGCGWGRWPRRGRRVTPSPR